MEDGWRIRKWYSVHCTVHYIVYIYSYNVRVIGEGCIQDVIKKRMNSSYSSNRPAWCKIASATRNLINSVPQTAATILAFSSVYCTYILLLWYEYIEDNRRSTDLILNTCCTVNSVHNIVNRKCIQQTIPTVCQ